MLNKVLQGYEYLLELSTESWCGLPIWIWLVGLLVFVVFLILDRAFDPKPKDEVARQLWMQRKQDLFKH